MFEPLLNAELQEWCEIWNSHTVRSQRFGSSASGVPNVMYRYPYLTKGESAIECGLPLPDSSVRSGHALCDGMATDRVPQSFRDWATALLRRRSLHITLDNASAIFRLITSRIREL